ncbi:MAG: twin-arginine translocase subunit TatC [Acidobacteriota bacterium]|nr:twin-arginine translocase subunit TatC [Acidobacteriota bacterium]
MASAIPASSNVTPPPLRRVMVHLLVAVTAIAKEMTFIEHLEELRKRILWAVVSVAATFAACWIYAGDLYEIASAPIRMNPAVTLSVSRPQDIFGLHMKVTLVASIFFAAPLILTQAWLFISPGLHRHERRYAIPFVLSASILFIAGGAFGYFVAFPVALTYLLDWIVASKLTPIIDAVEYFDLFFSIMVALGIVFQIPAVIFVLSRIGLITAGMLVRYFKHAVLGCVVVAAIITPTTDFGNMLVIAGPMIVLYGVGIGVAWLFGKKRRAA